MLEASYCWTLVLIDNDDNEMLSSLWQWFREHKCLQSFINLIKNLFAVSFQCVLRERRWSDVSAEMWRPTLGKTCVSKRHYTLNSNKKLSNEECKKSSLYSERTFAPILSHLKQYTFTEVTLLKFTMNIIESVVILSWNGQQYFRKIYTSGMPAPNNKLLIFFNVSSELFKG